MKIQKEVRNMARPAKAVAAKTGKITKAEEQARKEQEDKLKGNADKLVPPSYLSDNQTDIFNFILDELKESSILGNLDIFVLAQTAICIDRLQTCEIMMNEKPQLLLDNAFMAGKDKYNKNFFRCCNELCLSPQSRAKLSIRATQPEKKKTLMDILRDEDE
jgi:P27 family predicted phage terminase small subunit